MTCSASFSLTDLLHPIVPYSLFHSLLYFITNPDCNAPVWDLWDNQNSPMTQQTPFMVSHSKPSYFARFEVNYSTIRLNVCRYFSIRYELIFVPNATIYYGSLEYMIEIIVRNIKV